MQEPLYNDQINIKYKVQNRQNLCENKLLLGDGGC